MGQLNLTANNTAEQRIKDYLEQNASEVLIEKINNGVEVQKDGKTLVNKKTLGGFMNYATEEARKQADGSNYACIDDQTVFGWAVHYFEEESIIGKLYNPNGEEYNAPKPAKSVELAKPAKVEVKEQPKPQNQQIDLFSILGGVQ